MDEERQQRMQQRMRKRIRIQQGLTRRVIKIPYKKENPVAFFVDRMQTKIVGANMARFNQMTNIYNEYKEKKLEVEKKYHDEICRIHNGVLKSAQRAAKYCHVANPVLLRSYMKRCDEKARRRCKPAADFTESDFSSPSESETEEEENEAYETEACSDYEAKARRMYTAPMQEQDDDDIEVLAEIPVQRGQRD